MTSLKPQTLSALILDDHALIRDILRSHLRAMGFREVFVANTVLDAEKTIRNSRPDIVFVDWVLPVESGYSMLKKFRADKSFDDIAFVMVTGQNDVSAMTEAMQAGATSYVVKPIIGADFIGIVEVTLEWLAQQRQKATAVKG